MQTAQKYDIGNFLAVAFIGKASFKAALYKNNELVKTINNTDKIERKILITEAVELGATKIKLAKVFGICRQTIDNYLDVKRRYGIAAIPGGFLSPLMEGVSYPFFRKVFITPRNLRLY